MTDKKQPEALRRAEQYDHGDPAAHGNAWKVAVCTELRRQHAELETLRAKLKVYEDLGGAADDVQLLRMGYAAARLEIESLRKEHADELAVAYMCGASREKELAAQQTGAAYAALPEPITYQIAELKACEHGDALVGWRVEPSRQSFDASMRPKRKLYTEGDMHDFADRTHALRASHGQAPAQAAPAGTQMEPIAEVIEELENDGTGWCAKVRWLYNPVPVGEQLYWPQPTPAAVAVRIGYGPKVTVRRSCSDCKACNSESYAVQGDSGHYVYCEHPSLPESKYIGDTRWDTPHWCPVSAPTTQPAPQQGTPLMPKGDSAAPKLRAMAANYPAGHLWDKLDAQACIRGALEIEALRAAAPSPAAQGDALDAARWRALLACGRIRIIGTAGVTGTGAHNPKALDPNKQPYGNYVHFGAEFWSTFPDQDYYNTKENPAYARATLTEFADAARAAQEGK